MVEGQARQLVVRLAEARHEHQVRLDVQRMQQGVEQVRLVLAIAILVLQHIGGGVRAVGVDAQGHGHIAQPGDVVVERQHLVPVA